MSRGCVPFPLAASASFIISSRDKIKTGLIIEASRFAAVGVHQQPVSVAKHMNCRKKGYGKQPWRSCTARARRRALLTPSACTTARVYLPRPCPVTDFRHVLSVFLNVMPVLDEFILKLLLQVDTRTARLRETVDGVDHEVKAVEVVQHRHVEGGRNRTLLLVAADMQVRVIAATVCEPVNQPRVG